MAETLGRDIEGLETRIARGHGRRPAHPSTTARVASQTAREATQAFSELRSCFRTSSQLRKALNWSAPTLRSWTAEQGPARPRTHSVQRVLLLRDLANAAKRWVSDPRSVGDWLLEPQPSLGDATPVQVVLVLGREGVDGLIANIAQIAPREHVSRGPVNLDADALRDTLRRLGVPALADIEPGSEVDLSDFD